MDCKFKKLRDELDELGYYQTLSIESVPLVEKLVADLKITTESLQKYMKLAQKAIEERDNLQLGSEPYKCDNARLVKECNDLHLAFLQYRDQNDKIQTDLKTRLEILKQENSDYASQIAKLKNQNRNLEIELIEQGESLLNLKPKSKTSLKSSSTTLPKKPVIKKSNQTDLKSVMALSEEKIACLCKDIKRYKEKNLQLTEENDLLKCQLKGRDQEIMRLNNLLEGGRPLTAIKKDCMCLCGKNSTEGVLVLHEEINKLTQEKVLLENRLKDALSKQHEAMKRALHLAEKNKLLEKELKDIDTLALAVEAECNNTVKNNTEKVNRLQDRMQCTVLQIQNLERENAKLRQEKQELSADLDAVILEKKHLQTVLENSLDEKKRLSDRINNFVIIEHDLNMEIDRLTRLSAEQKRKIAELDNSLISEKADFAPAEPKSRNASKQSVHSNNKMGESNYLKYNLPPTRDSQACSKRNSLASNQSPTRNKGTRKLSLRKTGRNSGSPQRLQSDQNYGAQLITPNECKCECCSDCCGSSKHLKELLDKEIEFREQQALHCMENLKSEKDYYMQEYHKLLEQMRIAQSDAEKNAELLKKLQEKEQLISNLQHEIQVLTEAKNDLIRQVESCHRRETDDETPCLKPNCKRIHMERDILRADFERLEEEHNLARRQLEALSNSQMSEQERLKQALIESEEHIKKLELERHDLVKEQSSRSTTMNVLESECQSTKEQLRVCQSELNQQRALYNQLKALHEQTDRTLIDTQSKLAQAEAELARVMDEIQSHEKAKGSASKESAILRNDIEILRQQMAQIDREKDDLLAALDNKTEKLVVLENDLKSKEQKIESLEDMVTDLKKKLMSTRDEKTSHELLLRNSHDEISALREELERMRLMKEAATQENRRLQDDLTSVTSDCRNSRKELELYKRQVDDLKTQLQQYVAEVKRAEDLISSKEIERNEILDQFRSLSNEANALENTNHTLENEATQSKIQLTVALDHAHDLERKLENKESVIRSYEKQIGDLTSQVASLEMQLKECVAQYEQAHTDLDRMRDLCSNLEAENNNYKRQLRTKSDEKIMVDRSVDRLRSERELLQRTVNLEKRSTETIEKDLDDAKRETTELRLLNQDLQDELQRLKAQVAELKERLHHCVCVPKPPITEDAPTIDNNNNKNNNKAEGGETPQIADESLLREIPEASVNIADASLDKKKEPVKRCNNSTCFSHRGKLKCQKCGRLKDGSKIGTFHQHGVVDNDAKSARHWRFSKTGSTMTENGCVSVCNRKLNENCFVKSYVTVDNGAQNNKNVVNYTLVHELQCAKSHGRPD